MSERRKRIILPGEPVEAGVQISDGRPEEFYELDKIKVTEGVEYGWLDGLRAEYIERTFDSPGTLLDEPVPPDFWQAVAGHIDGQVRRTLALDLRNSRESARKWAQLLFKNKVEAMTPMRAQMDLHDMLVLASPTGDADGETMRCFREACYVQFQRRYLARSVG